MYARLLLAAALVALASCGEVVQPGTPDGGTSTADAIPHPDSQPDQCSTDEDCPGAHQFCDPGGGARVCACVAGYTETAEGCAWTGALGNAGFTDTSAWTVEGALVNPNGTGSADAGELFFTTDAVCNLGKASQTVRMPPGDKAEPLVAEIVYRSAGGGDFNTFDQVGAAFAVNEAWTMLPASTDWRTVRRCLSDNAYGGDVTFAVSVTDKVRECPANSSFTVSVDRFAIVPAMPGECAPPGAAVNGDAEAEGGWTFAANGDGAQAGIVEGAGEESSRAAEIRLTTNCTSASMSGRVVVPTPEVTPASALQFWWKGAQGTPTTLTIDGRPFTTLTATGAEQSATFCLPPWTYGGERVIEARLGGVTGSCADPLDRSFAMDNVRVTSTPACSPESQRGFESAPLPLVGASLPRGGSIEAIDDQTIALTGSGVLRLSATERCSSTTYETWVPTPAPDGAAGPALKLWYNVPANPVTLARYFAGGEKRNYSSGDLTESGTWSEKVICLDPDSAGRLSRVAVSLYGGSGSCTTFGGTEHADFDDFSLGTDAACAVE